MGVCVSQAAVAVQTLAIFNGIQVDWMDPLRGLLAIVSVASLSLKISAYRAWQGLTSCFPLFRIERPMTWLEVGLDGRI